MYRTGYIRRCVKEGVAVLIETYQEFGFTPAQVVDKVVEKFKVDRSFAKEQVEKYWK